MSQKTVVAVWNSANKGKTETLRHIVKDHLIDFCQDFNSEFFSAGDIKVDKIPETGDFKCIFNLGTKKIVVLSQGDPGTRLEEKLKKFAKEGYDLIICTCRTRGETTSAVHSIKKSHGYNIIWTSTYQSSEQFDLTQLNKLKASHIFDLIQSLNLI